MLTLKLLLASMIFEAHGAPRQLSLEGRRLVSLPLSAIAMAVDPIIFNLDAIALTILWRMANSNLAATTGTGVKMVGPDTW